MPGWQVEAGLRRQRRIRCQGARDGLGRAAEVDREIADQCGFPAAAFLAGHSQNRHVWFPTNANSQPFVLSSVKGVKANAACGLVNDKVANQWPICHATTNLRRYFGSSVRTNEPLSYGPCDDVSKHNQQEGEGVVLTQDPAKARLAWPVRRWRLRF